MLSFPSLLLESTKTQIRHPSKSNEWMRVAEECYEHGGLVEQVLQRAPPLESLLAVPWVVTSCSLLISRPPYCSCSTCSFLYHTTMKHLGLTLRVPFKNLKQREHAWQRDSCSTFTNPTELHGRWSPLCSTLSTQFMNWEKSRIVLDYSIGNPESYILHNYHRIP